MQHHVLSVVLVLGPAACADDTTVADAATETGGSSSGGSSSSGSPADSSTTSTSGASESTGIGSGAKCGDGILDANEDCDDGNELSNDGCSKDCLAESCGDGIVQASEDCDLGSENADDATCTSECAENVCGDGRKGPAEACDDGNTDDADGCSPDCTLEACGNGVIDAGEACDDGNLDDDDECTTLCAAPLCGDGIVSPSVGEDCDDANPDGDDECPNDCSAAVCGDGVVEAEETCDDGDANGDGVSLCSSSCALNICGDNYVVSDLEECDDGGENGDGASLCTDQCVLNSCGDGYHHLASEGCDAGERNGFVPCSSSCAVVPEVVEVALGWSFSCARYADGTVRCWGTNWASQLGANLEEDWIGDDVDEMPPPLAILGGPIAQITSGTDSSMCALRTDGAVVCWGSGLGGSWTDEQYGGQIYTGLLGPLEADAHDNLDSTRFAVGDDPGELPPTPIPLGPADAVHLSVANTSACAITSDGALRCWGLSETDVWPTLGYGTTVVRAWNSHFPPPPVNLGVSPIPVTHGWERTCVLGEDQFVRCFGDSSSGNLGQAGNGPQASGTTIEPPP